jgi:hypothetical protein
MINPKVKKALLLLERWVQKERIPKWEDNLHRDCKETLWQNNEQL